MEIRNARLLNDSSTIKSSRQSALDACLPDSRPSALFSLPSATSLLFLELIRPQRRESGASA
jgi:hypothetical protein